jgi:hypothetical protein
LFWKGVPTGAVIETEQFVMQRYTKGGSRSPRRVVLSRQYDQYLEVIPDEIKERDYGCGDPSAFVQEGEVVLDLGSGSGRSVT